MGGFGLCFQWLCRPNLISVSPSKASISISDGERGYTKENSNSFAPRALKEQRTSAHVCINVLTPCDAAEFLAQFVHL